MSRPSKKSDSAPAKKPRAKVRGERVQQAVYLTPAVHAQLRALAFDLETSQQALILEGIDLVFKKHKVLTSRDLDQA